MRQTKIIIVYYLLKQITASYIIFLKKKKNVIHLYTICAVMATIVDYISVVTLAFFNCTNILFCNRISKILARLLVKVSNIWRMLVVVFGTNVIEKNCLSHRVPKFI